MLIDNNILQMVEYHRYNTVSYDEPGIRKIIIRVLYTNVLYIVRLRKIIIEERINYE